MVPSVMFIKILNNPSFASEVIRVKQTYGHEIIRLFPCRLIKIC
jgi:hypothetical protein